MSNFTPYGDPNFNPEKWLEKAENIKDVPAPGRALLETYAGIPPEDVVSHVIKVVRIFSGI